MKPVFVDIKESTRRGKKWMATFYDVSEHPIKTVHFGASGYEDYTMHHDDSRKQSYISRHSNEDWDDPMSAGALSRWILWEYPDLNTAIQRYKEMFQLHSLPL